MSVYFNNYDESSLSNSINNLSDLFIRKINYTGIYYISKAAVDGLLLTKNARKVFLTSFLFFLLSGNGLNCLVETWIV